MFCEKVRVVFALKKVPYEVIDVRADEAELEIGREKFVEGVADGHVRGEADVVIHLAVGRSAEAGDPAVFENRCAHADAEERTGAARRESIVLILLSAGRTDRETERQKRDGHQGEIFHVNPIVIIVGPR